MTTDWERMRIDDDVDDVPLVTSHIPVQPIDQCASNE